MMKPLKMEEVYHHEDCYEGTHVKSRTHNQQCEFIIEISILTITCSNALISYIGFHILNNSTKIVVTNTI